MRARNTGRERLLNVILGAGLAASLTVGTGATAGAVGAADQAESPGSAAPNWTYSADDVTVDGDIDARAIGESISRGEAERRLRADRAASHLQDIVQARWPETFAGLWIDHDPYRINLAFTRDAAANVTELRTSFPYPNDLAPVDALRSFTALSTLQGKLASERNSLQQGRDVPGMPDAIRSTRGVYDLNIDIRAGQVEVRVARVTAAIRTAFTQRYGGPVVVVERGLAKPRTCTQADCRYAMLGGLQLEIPGQGWCSSAFTAYYTSDPSMRYALSAGHCYADTGVADRHNGGELYGVTTSAKKAYEVDAERIRRDSATPWRESSKFFVQGETYPRMVTSVTTYSSMAVGAYIGKTGYTTGTTRGYITSKTSAPGYVPNARNFVEADMCSAGGDSGSAIWAGNSGYGILSGGPDMTYCRNINGTMGTTLSSNGGTTVFGALSYATSALAVTVLTGVNLKPTAEFTHSCFLTDCTFDASASKDADGGITSYSWDFGDGSIGSGRNVTYSYTLPGLYTVKLTTKDNNGATTTKSVGIAVTAS